MANAAKPGPKAFNSPHISLDLFPARAESQYKQSATTQPTQAVVYFPPEIPNIYTIYRDFL